jgi:hypothetical protein
LAWASRKPRDDLSLVEVPSSSLAFDLGETLALLRDTVQQLADDEFAQAPPPSTPTTCSPPTCGPSSARSARTAGLHHQHLTDRTACLDH